MIHEAHRALLTNDEQARLIKDSEEKEWRVRKYLADPNMFTKAHRRKAQSAADIYKENGIILRRADNNRISGKRQVDNWLSKAPDGLPKMQIFNTCTNVISNLQNLIFDEHKAEDVDTTQDDHAYDALRYALMEKVKKKKPEDGKVERERQKALAALRSM